MKKKVLATVVSAYFAFLAGCNSDDKGGYYGPVKGDVVVITPPDDQTPPTGGGNDPQPTTGVDIGPNKRFAEVSAGVTGDAKYETELVEYHFGDVVVGGNGTWMDDQSFKSDIKMMQIIPLQGWIRYPKLSASDSNKKLPIVIFLHGNGDSNVSYQGFDYLAKNLAEQGYVVLSLDSMDITRLKPDYPELVSTYNGDPSSLSRAQLILATLDKLEQLDQFGGAGAIDVLKDKLDFENIGMMGHSRGGKAIYLTTKLNTQRLGTNVENLYYSFLNHASNYLTLGEKRFDELAGVVFGINNKNPNNPDLSPLVQYLEDNNIVFSKSQYTKKPYDFKAAFALAPADEDGIQGLTNIPMATLVPSCDGDLSNLPGAANYDSNRFTSSYDQAPKYQIWMRGANHNYFNSEWNNDDYLGFIEKSPEVVQSVASLMPCTPNAAGGLSEEMRFSPVDQKRTGLFLINSFMRYFVGGEQQFKSYWNAVGKLPSSACPEGLEACDEKVILSVQNSQRRLIENFNSLNAIQTNMLGGKVLFNGFAPTGVNACQLNAIPNTLGSGVQYSCLNVVGEVSNFNQRRANITSFGLVSLANQIILNWVRPNSDYELELNNLSTQNFDTLTFRVGAIDRLPAHEIEVELTDMNGKKVSVLASDFSDALYRFPRAKSGAMPLTLHTQSDELAANGAGALNMVGIPLAAFAGIDTSHLAKLSFKFPQQSGGLAMTDIQLQKLRN